MSSPDWLTGAFALKSIDLCPTHVELKEVMGEFRQVGEEESARNNAAAVKSSERQLAQEKQKHDLAEERAKNACEREGKLKKLAHRLEQEAREGDSRRSMEEQNNHHMHSLQMKKLTFEHQSSMVADQKEMLKIQAVANVANALANGAAAVGCKYFENALPIGQGQSSTSSTSASTRLPLPCASTASASTGTPVIEEIPALSIAPASISQASTTRPAEERKARLEERKARLEEERRAGLEARMKKVVEASAKTPAFPSSHEDEEEIVSGEKEEEEEEEKR